MLYFKAIIKEETQTEFGVVPKSQEYYVPALSYADAEKIFAELINQNMICTDCISDGGKKLFEFKKILKEEIEDIVGSDNNYYYKVPVKFSVGEGNKTSTVNFYVSGDDCGDAFKKLTEFIDKVGYLSNGEIISITKKDRIKTIFNMKDEDYQSVYGAIVN